MDEKNFDAKEMAVKFVNKFQYNSPVILTFAVASFVVLVLSALTRGSSDELLFSIYRTRFTDPMFYIRLLGHTLGHVSFEHYINNFLIIMLVGPVVEEKYGWKKLLIMIVLTSVIIGLLHAAVSNRAALMGASGVAFMFIILNSYVSLKAGKIPVTLVLCIVLFLGREIANQVTLGDRGISHLSHIIGGLCGAFFGFFMNKDKLLKTEPTEGEVEN